ncbi:alkaline phosphatase [Bacterioplanoides pacificum]|uniref:Alkaline phosphatase n=1 Tax=Bacterioplanoides pacificum TaxID=1171596 RepID=A0ABV7VS78_9GAMM
MPYFLRLPLLLSLFALSACEPTLPVKDNTRSEQWYQQGQQRAALAAAQTDNTGPAKNLILVVGDGMGITTHTAARIFTGQQQGLLGEEYNLSFETLPHSALIKTYNSDQQTPDSAGTMTALISGSKTRAGVLAVSDKVIRSDCASQAGNELQTLFDVAEQQGKASGIVTTARITHATPAALYAHSAERNWESDDQLNDSARQSGCQDIAAQLIDYQQQQQRLEVIFGGGRRHFLPASMSDGQRRDGRNLMTAWQQQADHHVATSRQQLLQADLSQGHWLGLFAASHLPYVAERDASTPGLLDMTRAALQRLQHNDQGYVLMIEAARIDHAHHQGQGQKALQETAELDQTVAWLLKHTDRDNTLLVVTADHSHTLTLAGYPTRGNPITGVVISNDDQGRPERQPYRLDDGGYYTTMSYRNGPGAVDWQQHNRRPSVNPEATQSPDYRQQALVPLDSETHGGEDVALYASGPWAHLFGGTMEQHWVYHVLQHALNPKAQQAAP